MADSVDSSGALNQAVQRPDSEDRAHFRLAKRRADAARNFPVGTDPCSRHAYLMAENMVKKHGYPMLSEEPWHCAISIMHTVAALWETRAKLEALSATCPSAHEDA